MPHVNEDPFIPQHNSDNAQALQKEAEQYDWSSDNENETNSAGNIMVDNTDSVSTTSTNPDNGESQTDVYNVSFLVEER